MSPYSRWCSSPYRPGDWARTGRSSSRRRTALQFSAVIGNRGNVDQKGLKVTVGIRTESGEAVATADSHTVDLAPGELGSVLFAPESVAPGTEYLLTFSLTVVEDEVNTDDNLWESEVRINPPG